MFTLHPLLLIINYRMTNIEINSTAWSVHIQSTQQQLFTLQKITFSLPTCSFHSFIISSFFLINLFFFLFVDPNGLIKNKFGDYHPWYTGPSLGFGISLSISNCFCCPWTLRRLVASHRHTTIAVTTTKPTTPKINK